MVDYSDTITFTDPQSGKRVTVDINRSIYQNSKIDPDLEVPEGTKYSNGYSVKKCTTNLELMLEGKAPFIESVSENEESILVQVELHHLDGTETHRGADYFNIDKSDGTLVELPSDKHDKYSRVIHEGQPSFRRDKVDGKKVKTYDSNKYNKFRTEYWKKRAQGFLNKNE